ncbi:MAG TPA: FadR/GntR family transcriptional regulator [Pseudolysinimonas sp.]|nr:FadR/GntR family transcriptional regulator [Pseudolysinimonas sp.]
MTGLTIPPSAGELALILESEILDEEIAERQRLPSERQLSERFGVSRPAVREALRQLETKGLITVHPGRGSFVADLHPMNGAGLDVYVRRGDVTPRHLVAARRMLECESAALAAQQRTDEQAATLTALAREFDDARTTEDAARVDVRLHEAISLASQNPVLQTMFAAIRDLVHGMALRSLADPEVHDAGGPLHARIVDAIVARDADLARQLMDEHIGLALDLYGADLDRPLRELVAARTRGPVDG